MARPKPKSSSDTTLNKNASEPARKAELILKDFRVSKLVSERFLAPEKARVGTFSVKSDAKKAIFPDNLELSRAGMVTYSLGLTGYTRIKTDEGSETKEKSFSIEIEAEGRFETLGDLDLDDASLCASALRPIILLVHGLCVHHARTEADNMGYRSVRPDYQVEDMPDPILQAD